MINDIEKTIREYLPNIIHMSLATCTDEKPWVCELHFVYDDDLNLYWLSKKHRRHSVEIEKNPKVSGNIVVQHGPTDKPRGVYFEGKAEIITDVDEDHNAFKLYCERFGTDKSLLEEISKEDGHQFYKVTVDNYYLFDNKKYKLPWKGGRK